LADLLAQPSGQQKPHFFGAGEILTSNPLTINDYRKLLIDMEGVKNAWLQRCGDAMPEIHYDSVNRRLSSQSTANTQRIALNGLYTVLIDKTDEAGLGDDVLITAIGNRLSRHRNLCEDFERIIVLPKEEIRVRARLYIAEQLDADELMARVYFHLAEFISPTVRFYSLDEMVQRGSATEEIFNGPLLQNGFVDEDELERVDKKKQLNVSDLIHIILDLDGIKAVENIAISSKLLPTPQKWALELDPNRAPRLNPLNLMHADGDICFYKGDIPCVLNLDRIREHLDTLSGKLVHLPQAGAKMDIAVPAGAYRDLTDYVSIQQEFPANYGIGQLGLPATATETRKAQAKQLQAYLLFYDQILANYFCQLDHVKDLLSPFQPQANTYFCQMLDDVPGLNTILGANQTTIQSLTEDDQGKFQRKNRILDHLLARFCETFTDYALMLYKGIDENYIRDKTAFLQQYPLISSRRGSAANYLDTGGGTDNDNLSGLKRSILMLLGLGCADNRDLAASQSEGFHLVEHILLRPKRAFEMGLSISAQDDDERDELVRIPPQHMDPDPYSFQITFVFPDWPGRFQDENFRALIQQTIIAQTPAHITPELRWLNRQEMKTFEGLYHAWRREKAKGRLSGSTANRLVAFLALGTPAKAVLAFDGKGGYVKLPPMETDFSRGLTIEARVFYDNLNLWSRIIDLGNGRGNDNIVFANQATSNHLCIDIHKGNTSNQFIVEKVLEIGKWLHLAVTIDRQNRAHFFKAGKIVQSGTLPLPPAVTRQTNWIAKSNWNADEYFHGKVSEIRIWNICRPPETIKTDGDRALTGDEEGLVACWQLNEGAGEMVADLSVNEYHGTICGARWEFAYDV
jgi:hypothetical protein